LGSAPALGRCGNRPGFRWETLSREFGSAGLRPAVFGRWPKTTPAEEDNLLVNRSGSLGIFRRRKYCAAITLTVVAAMGRLPF